MGLARRTTYRLFLGKLFLLSLLALSIAVAGCGGSAGDAPAGKTTLTTVKASENESLSAKEILQRMAKTYREVVTYTDRGVARVQYKQGDKPTKQEFPFSVTFAQPNRLWVKAYEGDIVCDGKRLCAVHETVPGYVRTADAPERLTIQKVFGDEYLWAALNERQVGGPLQLELLLNDKILDNLLAGASGEPELLESDPFDIESCYRVKLPTPQGGMIFWVGQRTFLLRRLEHPTDEFKKMLEQDGPVSELAVVAEFLAAKVNEPLEASAFQFAFPNGAKEVKQFIGPSPSDVMGKKPGNFEFTSLADNQKITAKSLEGKVVVLDFWASWCTYCLQKMPHIAKAYEKFKTNDKVRFLAVSIDQPDVADEKIKAKLAELNLDLPAARDAQMSAFSVFKIPGVPSRIILGPDGSVQAGSVGLPPENLDPVTDLTQKVEALLAGKNLYADNLAEFERAMMEPPPEPREQEQSSPPEVKIAPKSDPRTVKLQSRWVCPNVASPGNMLLVEGEAGAARLYVIDNLHTVAELNPESGKLITRHELKLPERVAVAFLRTLVDRGGKRYFAASAVGQSQAFVFDAQWQLLGTYAPGGDAAVGDAQLVDLDGDGEVELAVGYLGQTGVHLAALQGRKLWADDKLHNVVSLAVTPADDQGRRKLLCVHPPEKQGNANLEALDHSGQKCQGIAMEKHYLRWLLAASLDGGKDSFAGIAFTRSTPDGPVTDALVGVDLSGKELWTYPLPTGQPPWLEQLGVGRLVGQSRHWIAAAADGSLHFVSADGKPLDQFHVGSAITGFAALEADGQPVLVVATGNRLEAWQVEAR